MHNASETGAFQFKHAPRETPNRGRLMTLVKKTIKTISARYLACATLAAFLLALSSAVDADIIWLAKGYVVLKQSDGAEVPLSSAKVVFYSKIYDKEYSAKTDATGKYEVRVGSGGGGYFVVVSGPGAKPAVFRASEVLNFTLEVGDGSELTRRQAEAALSSMAEVPSRASGVNSFSPKDKPSHALVIGNAAYPTGLLLNPANDAEDIARALTGIGFSVMVRQDLGKREMEDEIRAFGKKLQRGGIGLFYFAGHGIQVDGRNYLIPIGANVEKEQDIEYEAVDAGRIFAEMEASETLLNIIVLDACRNNPFARRFRSSSRGLAVMIAPSGTIIAYATAPGSTASDGEGRKGLFTQELLRYIRVPSLKIEDLFKRVRISVKEKSQGKQVPWETSSLEADFFFDKDEE